jgi:glycerol-3-phosphate dehydrogenase
MRSDIIVIGAGITGSTIARELSKYRQQILVVEKRSDVAFGSPTKGNTGLIHAGYDDQPGTRKANLCTRGNMLWHSIAKEISAPLKETGSLVVALNKNEEDHLRQLKERGEKNGVPLLEIVEDKKRLLKIEPNLNKDATAALFAPTAAITAPYELALAVSENATQNGARFLFETEATGIITKNGEITGIRTSRGRIKADCVINAAGLESDEVSAMAGLRDFTIHPRKGEYYLFDKKLSGLVRHILFPVPTPISKGIVVTSTPEGNVLIGPNACDVEDKEDLNTTSTGLSEVYNGALKLVPGLAQYRNRIITYFSSLRPETGTGDFIIRSYDEPKGFVNVAGIRSPGLTSAPAIAEMVVDLIKESGLDLVEKELFISNREPIDHAIRELDFSRAERLISEDSNYGHVICRCEHISEAEIVEAVRRGATTLDGVKFRTRAGMGRCQGGFCTPHIIRILAKELGIPPTEVTKKGGASRLLLCEAKRLWGGED